VDESAWPDDALLTSAAAVLGVAPAALSFGPSDDYELLIAVDPAGRADCEQAAVAAGMPLTFVGRCTDAPGQLTLRAADGTARLLAGAGYDHFGHAG
jgi:thiamine-monophosphate kinase